MKTSVLILCFLAVATAVAQIPRTLNYQGTLATGSTPVPDGNYSVTFRLYEASAGGSTVWTEAQLVAARNGVFNAILGKIVALPLSFNTSYWLSLQVGADPELSPRLELTSVSYSLHAAVADSARKMAANSVSSVAILDGSITGADVATGTLSAANLLDEPGLSSSYSNDFTYPPVGGAVVPCDSVELSIPAAGYVFVIASGLIQLYHTSGSPTRVDVYVNTVRNVSSAQGCMGLIPAANPTGPSGIPFMITKVYFESTAGTKRYYLLSSYSFGTNPSTNIPSATTSALYFPTLRGTINAPADGLPILSAGTAPDGTVRPIR